MSKTIPASLLAHYALGTTTVAHAIFLEREDGEQFGFTDHDEDDVVDGFTYECGDPGFTWDDITIATGLDVGNMRMRVLHTGNIFTSADLLHEKWKNTRFTMFRYNHQANPITDVDECLAGHFGEIEILNNELVIELHDLRRFMNETVGAARSKTCRYRLGSTTMATGGLCMKDISAAPFTVPFTVTHITGTGRTVFRAAALSASEHPDDWFGEGSVEFLTGNLAGVHKKIYAYDDDGTFTLSLPTFAAIQIGDTGTAVVGCRKRFTEDCVVKFQNGVNFGGEPHSRNVDTLTRPADATS